MKIWMIRWLQRLPQPSRSVISQRHCSRAGVTIVTKVADRGTGSAATPPAQAGHSDIESLLRSLLPGSSAPAVRAQQGSHEMELEYGVCFSCGKAGHGTTRCDCFD